MWHIFLPLPDIETWKIDLSHNKQALQFADHLSPSSVVLGKHKHPCDPVVHYIGEPEQIVSIQANM